LEELNVFSMTISQNPIRVFLSYAREDEQHLQKLKTHLSMLKQQGLISTWDARQIVPGTNWAMVTDKQFELASIILLLVSADFLASDDCYQVEMKRAMERQETSQTRVIPIIVGPCDWSCAPFVMLQCLPYNRKPITTWNNRDEAWTNVAEGIRKTIEDLHQETEFGSKLVPSVDRSYVTYERQPQLNGSSPTSDAQNLGTLLHTLNCHTSEVYSIVWSPDGRYLASTGADKTIFITEYATQHIFQLPGEHTKTIFTLSWSPDGTRLCSGGQDGFIHVWDVAARKKLLTYDRHRISNPFSVVLGQSEIYSIAWSPDGRLIASGGGEGDCTAHIWDALSGERYYQYRGHGLGQDEVGFHATTAISSVAWSPDGNRLATASCKESDAMEKDFGTKVLKVIPGFSHFMAWNQYAKIHIWDALTGDKVRIYPGHKIGVTALAWSPDGKAIASASKDKTVHVWNPATLRSSSTSFQHTVLGDHTAQVKAVAWSPDSIYLASAGNDATVQVRNISTGERIYTYRGHVKCVRALAWSPIGDIIASAGDDRTIHLWKASQKPDL